MQVANISQFRKNLKTYIETVSDNHDTLIVNGNGKTVVVISLDEYNSMDETTYLTSNPANKKRLDDAIYNFRKNEDTERELIEL